MCVCILSKNVLFVCFYVLALPGFSASSAGKESACKAGDSGSTTGSERSPGEGIGYPLTAAMKLKDAYSLEEK